MDTEVNNTHGAPPGDVGAAPARRRGPVQRAGAGLRRAWWLLPAIAAAVTAGVHIPVSASNLVLAHPSEGLICTAGKVGSVTTTIGTTTTTTATRSFLLTARDGYITTPDGNSIYMWSYANGDQGFQYPGPFLCANEGDQVTVTLRNSLPSLVDPLTHVSVAPPTSIVFTGIPGVRVDGGLPQPELATGSLSKAAAPGGTVTYTFTAGQPGTYTYESGTDPQLQVQMGMVGGLVVRASTACTATTHCRNAYDNTFSRYDSGHEYVHLLSEVDPDLHHWVEVGHSTFDWSKYNARYYMINGRSFPDTIAPNGVSNLPTQPYGSLVHVQPRNTDSSNLLDYNPDPSLVRYINAGPVAYPFHPHSNHESTVGVDGHQLDTAAHADASIERFDINVAPGQTVDSLFTWVDAQNWQPDNGTSDPGNPVQVPVPSQADRFEGPYWNGTPYLGEIKPVATGLTRYNECGEFYHVAHSHALFQVTNFGFSGGGMLTMVRVDPPPSLQNKNGVTCTVPGK